MKYNMLGETGLAVSSVSFGAAPLGNMFGAVDEKAALRTVGAAIDVGVNLFDTAPYYGDGLSERRLGVALRGSRGKVVVGTKAGRYGDSSFDYRPAQIRESLERSLRLLDTDYIDIFQLHDIEFADLDRLFDESYAELIRLRDEGKCRFIGMTGYPMHVLRRAIEEVELDTVLSYAHFTLLNTRLATDLLPACRQRGTAVMNAAAVNLGLLTRSGTRYPRHPAGEDIQTAAVRARRLCEEHDVDVAFLANQFSIQRSGCPTTVVGTTNIRHLDIAVRAASTPIDEQLLAEVLEATANVQRLSWVSGSPENHLDEVVQ